MKERVGQPTEKHLHDSPPMINRAPRGMHGSSTRTKEYSCKTQESSMALSRNETSQGSFKREVANCFGSEKPTRSVVLMFATHEHRAMRKPRGEPDRSEFRRAEFVPASLNLGHFRWLRSDKSRARNSKEFGHAISVYGIVRIGQARGLGDKELFHFRPPMKTERGSVCTRAVQVPRFPIQR